jgi:hypothetical protein
MTRQKLIIIFIVFFLAIGWNAYTLQGSLVSAYSPNVGDQTSYDYGFINVLNNQTATEINYWTHLLLSDSNYTMNWHQYVNLSIRVSHLVPSGPVIQAYYNFSVNIFSNVVTVSNSTWQTTVTLNGSVSAPAPTGVSSGLVDYPTTQGLPGFFLDDATSSTITTGTNVIIGESFWQTVSLTLFSLGGSEQWCYQLFNSSSISTHQTDTTLVIDQDVGIYYQANETHIATVNSVATYLTYYYQVILTNIAVIPPPNPLPIYIAAAIMTVILIIVVVLLIRALWLRRRQGAL